MAIVGRDLDVSERKDALFYCSQVVGQSVIGLDGGNIGISAVVSMFLVPYPCTIQSGVVFSLGNSASPQHTLTNFRWNGSAMATYAISISAMVLTVAGTSGPQGLSGLPAAGSTLLNLQQGDLLAMVTSAANTATGRLVLELVVKKTQDLVAYNNVTT